MARKTEATVGRPVGCEGEEAEDEDKDEAATVAVAAARIVRVVCSIQTRVSGDGSPRWGEEGAAGR